MVDFCMPSDTFDTQTVLLQIHILFLPITLIEQSYSLCTVHVEYWRGKIYPPELLVNYMLVAAITVYHHRDIIIVGA